MRRAAGLAVALLLPLAAACQVPAERDAAGTSPAVPFAGCTGLERPPAAEATVVPGGGTPAGEAAAAATPAQRARWAAVAATRPLPALSLPCYADGRPFQVASLRGPAVVNLWASWCPPCRRELPVLRDFAVRNRGRMHVLGVVSGDTRAASTAAAGELGLAFPHLFDDQGRLMRALERSGLPVTLFVDAEGRIRFVYNAEALDRDSLDLLTRRHLGVAPA